MHVKFCISTLPKLKTHIYYRDNESLKQWEINVLKIVGKNKNPIETFEIDESADNLQKRYYK